MTGDTQETGGPLFSAGFTAREQILGSFEEAWHDGDEPKIEDFLAEITGNDFALCVALIQIDLEFRIKAGELARVESYLSRFPHLRESQECIRDLLSAEIRLRIRNEPELTLGEYQTRFPELSEQLARLGQIDTDTSNIGLRGDTDTTVVRSDRIFSSVKSGGLADVSFGDYEILEMIAEGGMGAVYKARQTSLNRIVALKMIKSGELAGDDEVQRFHAEAEAAAALDHPNIVPIHEVGEQDHQHFFTMGFVAGESLQDRLKEGPLPPKEAAELLRTIAEAVQYAHEQGIVHRDLKPGNILVEADGKPRVTDFGLAKKTDTDSGMTATGQILGTPSYMPPEQAQGRADQIGPGSDVYSLGAILYAVLTGRAPFQAANVLDTLKQVVEQEPVPPRQLNSTIPRDLETICLKCLQKEPARRYSTAGEVADELYRYLDGRPILARPAGRLERVMRWCKRNPAAATVIGLLTALAVGGPIVAYEQMRLRESESAAKRLAVAKEELADRNLILADEVLTKFVTEIGREGGPLSLYPATQPLRQKLLEMGRAYFEKLIEDNAATALSYRMATANFNLAVILSKISGENEAALSAHQRAIRIVEQFARQKPTVTKYQIDLSTSYRSIGALYSEMGKPADALPAFQKALKIHQKLSRQDSTATEHQSEVAEDLGLIGNLYRATGKPAEALKSHQQSVTIHERLADNDPNVMIYQRRLSTAYINTGVLYSETGQSIDALNAYQKAVSICERLVTAHPSLPANLSKLAGCKMNIAQLLFSSGKRIKALEALQQALALFGRVARENPTVREYQRDHAAGHTNIGNYYLRIGDFEKSLAAHRQALKILGRLAAENPKVTDYQNELAGSYNNIGALYKKSGKPDDALIAYEQAVQIRERLVLANRTALMHQSDLAGSLYNIGNLHLTTGKRAEALTMYLKAVKLLEQLVRTNPHVTEYQQRLAAGHNNCATCYLNTQQPQEALAAYRQALTVREQLALQNPNVTKYQNDLAAAHNNIGLFFVRAGKLAESRMSFQQALKIFEPLARENPTVLEYQQNLAGSLNSFGALQSRAGESDEALATCQRAMNIYQKLVQQQPKVIVYQVDLAVSLNNIGNFYHKSGLQQEALEYLDRAIRILIRLPQNTLRSPATRTNYRNAYMNRAQALGELARHREAVADWRKTVELESGRFRAHFQRQLCLSLARSGQHAPATDLAGQLLKTRMQPASGYVLVVAFTLSAESAARDSVLDVKTQLRLRAQYNTVAIRILKGLRTANLFKTTKYRALLQTDSDLNVLRHRDDFREFAKSVGVELPAWARRPQSAFSVKQPSTAKKRRTRIGP